eukprot:scaffold11190_cov95-Skeletonema_marinoi.AAC.1
MLRRMQEMKSSHIHCVLAAQRHLNTSGLSLLSRRSSENARQMAYALELHTPRVYLLSRAKAKERRSRNLMIMRLSETSKWASFIAFTDKADPLSRPLTMTLELAPLRDVTKAVSNRNKTSS